RRRRGDDENDGADAAAGDDGDGEQLSLFTAISAVPLDEQGRPLDRVRVYDAEEDAIPDLVGAPGTRPDGDPPLPLVIEAAGGPAPVPSPDPEPDAGPPGTAPTAASAKASPLARRRQLREQNSTAVADLAHSTGKSHATLNAELNRRAGIRRISEATIRQLERRLEVATGMMRRIQI